MAPEGNEKEDSLGHSRTLRDSGLRMPGEFMASRPLDSPSIGPPKIIPSPLRGAKE